MPWFGQDISLESMPWLGSVPLGHHVRGYYADTREARSIRSDGRVYGGCLMFVFECPETPGPAYDYDLEEYR